MMSGGHFFNSLPMGRLRRAVCAVLASLLCLLSQPAQAQTLSVATATGNAQAAIVAPGTFLSTQVMDFGRIAPRATAGTVVLEPVNGTCTATGGILQFDRCQAAEFVGQGVRNMMVRINLPANITLTGPSGTMIIDTLTQDVSPDLVLRGGNGNGLGAGNRRYQIVSTAGIFSINVGGTLRVGANQAAGVYTGTYAVTVVYQ
jgi:hypothetical protein